MPATVGVCGAVLTLFITTSGNAADWPMRGRGHSRNAVSLEKNAPVDWQIATARHKSKNIHWSAALGTNSWGDPVIANGLVWIGTNNGRPRDPRNKADASVLMCFRERDGKFLYQYVSPRLKNEKGRRFDWGASSLASSPLVEDDRLWFCSNRCETICLDIAPLRLGTGEPRLVWEVDMRKELGVVPRGMHIGSNTIHSSPASYKDFIYVNTTNARYLDLSRVPAPQAPSLVCFQKNSGKVVWQDNSPGENILDVQHGSPLVIEVNRRGQVIMGQGDGWLRSFDCLTGKLIWKFDINYKSPKRRLTVKGKRNYFVATPVFYKNRVYIGGGRQPEHAVVQGRLCCIDATKRGDISSELDDGAGKGNPNPNSGLVWEFVKRGENFPDTMHQTTSSVVIHDSLLIAIDRSGLVHCLDAETGKKYWTHDTYSGIFGSPLIADSKVYVPTEAGDVILFKLAKQKMLLRDHSLTSLIYSSPVYANGVLYVMTMNSLYAIQQQQ